MAVDLKIFTTVLVGSLLVTTGGVGAIASGGVAVAVPAPSDSGFLVEFDRLEGQGFDTHPTIGADEQCSERPLVVSEIEQGTIEGLTIKRDFQSPEVVPGDNVVRMKIESNGPVEFSGLTQEFTTLNGDLTFDEGQQINSEGTGDIENRFRIEADSVVIEDAQGATEGQFIDQISLEDMSVSIETNPDDPLPVDNNGDQCLN